MPDTAYDADALRALVVKLSSGEPLTEDERWHAANVLHAVDKALECISATRPGALQSTQALGLVLLNRGVAREFPRDEERSRDDR